MNNKKIIRSSQHGFTEEEVMFVQPDSLQWNSWPAGWGEHEVYLDFSKAFDTVSHKILLGRQLLYGLGDQTVSWTENCLNGQTQMLMIGGTIYSWMLMTSSVPQGSTLGPSTIFINELDDEAEHTIRNFSENIKLGGVTDSKESWSQGCQQP